MENMRKIICKGLNGRKDEIKVIVKILSAVYGFSLWFIVFFSGQFRIFLFLFSLILIFYALTVSIKKRKYRISIFHGIGATLAQLIWMSLWEGLMIGGVAILCGTFLGVTASVVTVLGGTYLLGWNMPVTIDGICIFQSFLFTTIVFLVSIVILTLDGASFQSDYGIWKREKMPKMKVVKPLNLIKISRRNRQFYQSKTYFSVAFSVLVIFIMTISLFGFSRENEKYKFWKKQTELSYCYRFRKDVLTGGISRQTIEELEKIPGITKVDREKYLNTNGGLEGEIQIGFEGWKESEYVKTQRHYAQDKIRKSVDQESDYFSVSEIRGVSPEDEQLLSAYEKEEKQGVLDRRKFDAGEECLLFLTPYQVRDLGFESVDYEASFIYQDDIDKSKKIYTYEKDEHAIQPGDIVEVRTPWGDAAITVGGIVYGIPETYGNVIAVGERFLDKIFTESTSELYNDITIWYDENIDFTEMDHKVTGVFHEIGLEEDVTNGRIVAKQNLDAMVSEMFRSMAIVLMSALLYVIIIYQVSLGYFEEERRRIGIFQSLGMDRKKLKKLYVSEGIFDVFFVFAVSLTGMGIWMIFKLRADTSFDSFYRLVKEIMRHGEEFSALAAAFFIAGTFFVFVYLTAVYVPIRKILKRKVLDNIR